MADSVIGRLHESVECKREMGFEDHFRIGMRLYAGDIPKILALVECLKAEYENPLNYMSSLEALDVTIALSDATYAAFTRITEEP